MRFHKYQALSNDYLVLENDSLEDLSVSAIQRICDRHLGIGSDGILTETPPLNEEGFGLRIFNPDGSEAEKSGNGLRIFSRYLWDTSRVTDQPFTVFTKSGIVQCEVRNNGQMVYVEMGVASFDSKMIPVNGPPRQVVDEHIEINGTSLCFTGVTVGNPHCVIFMQDPSKDTAMRIGPLLEQHELFPNRTNVQFVEAIDRHHIRIEIWERGAGYTLASGSSSCAAAAAAVRLGFCEDPVTVLMPGGSLEISISKNYDLTMLGPVQKVADGELASELLDHC